MSQIVWVLEGAFSRERLVRPGEGRDPYRGISLWGSVIAAFAEQRPGITGPGLRRDDGDRRDDEERRDDGDMSPHSRGAFHPSFASFITLIKDKGAGKTGWPLHPGPPRKEICASAREPQVQAVTTGLPCAMVYDLFRALLGEPAFATVTGAMR